LYVGDQPINGAIEAIAKVRNSHLNCRFVTNTSTLSIASLSKKLQSLSFDIPESEIISAPQAAFRYLKKRGDPVCRLLLAHDVKKDFSDFRQSDTAAEYIVIGDIGDAWSYPLMNEVFNCLMNGAELIAIHKNRFWQTEHGLQMDIGGFNKALEYASGHDAIIIDKPSKDFFQIALEDMNLDAEEVMMSGDDIDSDVGGAQAVGLMGVLVRTGKFRQSYADASSIRPTAVIGSIADLPALLDL